MSFEYALVDLEENTMAKAVVALTTTAFGLSTGISEMKRLIEMPESGVLPLSLGAFRDDVLVGFLACTPHRFMYKQEPVLVYQPSWAVTDPAWRGKGVFRNLITEAGKILREQGAAGMFASPNPKSGPVFTGPLGFQHMGPLEVGTVVGSKGLKLGIQIDHVQGALNPIDEDLLAWQKRRLGDEAVRVIEDEKGNRIWARQKYVKKLGIAVPYWLIGGVIADSANTLATLLKQLDGPQLRLFFLTPNSSIKNWFHHRRQSNSNYLVWKAYGDTLPENLTFDCMMGVFDHY